MNTDKNTLLAKAFDQSDLAFCIIQVLLNEEGKPYDWKFIYANDALAKIEGVSKEVLLSHTFFEIFPEADTKWFDYYYPAAYENQSFVFSDVSEEIGYALRIRCFPVEYGYCGCVLEDITSEFDHISSKISELKTEELFKVSKTDGYAELIQHKMLAALACFDAFVGTFVSSYYLDLNTGKYIAFSQAPEYQQYGKYGNWSLFDDYISKMIHKADQEELTRVSRLDYIRERLSKEERYFTLVRDLGTGTQRWYVIRFMRGADVNHVAIGFLDVTDQVEAERELIAVRDLVNVARWNCVINPDGTIQSAWASDELRHILGYENEVEFPNDLEFWETTVHPEDLAAFHSSLYTAINDKTGDTPFDCHYRIANKDGEYLWIRIAAYINRNQDGVATDLIGIFVDVDDTYRREERRRELEITQVALKEALAAAEHASKAKTIFLNSISHDIRTPMNAIIGFTALAASHMDNREQVTGYLEKIQTASNHLLSLINSVLDMSRIESGNMKIEEKKVHLPDVFRDIRTIIQSSIKSKQLELVLDTVDVVNEDVMCDRLRLNQILLNLVGNSVKFTEPGGTISIRIVQKTSTVSRYANYEFHVKDTGIGIGPEYLEHIFEPFTREEKNEVRETQGSGLGMAITKNIVDLMGGTIRVESELGKGTEFIIDLPLKIVGESVKYDAIPELKGIRALVADDDSNTAVSVSEMLGKIGMRADWTLSGKEAVLRTEVAKKQQDEYGAYIIDWLMPDMNGIETVRRIRRIIGNEQPIIILTAYDWTDMEEDAREAGVTGFVSKPIFMSELQEVLAKPFRHFEETKESEEKDRVDFSGKHILLVEDNEFNQEVAVDLLTDEGFLVDVAEDGQIAVDMIRNDTENTYDVVLMDIQMPNMNGYEAARAIRALDSSGQAEIPIIAMTANAFEEDRKMAFDAGMNAHLPKPIRMEKLMEVLTDILD